MRVSREIELKYFDFWSGARSRAEAMTSEELDTIQERLEEEYPEGMTETELNDFIWFEGDTWAVWLGYACEEDWRNAKREVEQKLNK